MGNDPQPTRAERQRARQQLVERATGVPAEPGGMAMEGTEAVSTAVARALLPFLTRDDGWLRISAADDGDVVYFKWKWTRGPHANKYVMTVYPASEADEAMRALAIKVHAVDRGEKAAVKDHYFHG